MVFNVHLLLHIVQTVLDWGPLWATSNFAFESANHYILQAIKNARGAPMQIQRYVNQGYCISMLEKAIFQNTSEQVEKFRSRVIHTQINNIKKLSNDVLYFGKMTQASEKLITEFNLNRDSQIYSKMIKDKCLYVSSDIQSKRSDSSVAQLFNGQYVRLKYFVTNADNQQAIIYQKLKTEEHSLCVGVSHLKIVVGVDDELSMTKVSEVKTICVYFNIDKDQSRGTFVCALPNLLNYWSI